jgi:hypothetical protein
MVSRKDKLKSRNVKTSSKSRKINFRTVLIIVVIVLAVFLLFKLFSPTGNKYVGKNEGELGQLAPGASDDSLVESPYTYITDCSEEGKRCGTLSLSSCSGNTLQYHIVDLYCDENLKCSKKQNQQLTDSFDCTSLFSRIPVCHAAVCRTFDPQFSLCMLAPESDGTACTVDDINGICMNGQCL